MKRIEHVIDKPHLTQPQRVAGVILYHDQLTQIFDRSSKAYAKREQMSSTDIYGVDTKDLQTRTKHALQTLHRHRHDTERLKVVRDDLARELGERAQAVEALYTQITPSLERTHELVDKEAPNMGLFKRLRVDAKAAKAIKSSIKTDEGVETLVEVGYTKEAAENRSKQIATSLGLTGATTVAFTLITGTAVAGETVHQFLPPFLENNLDLALLATFSGSYITQIFNANQNYRLLKRGLISPNINQQIMYYLALAESDFTKWATNMASAFTIPVIKDSALLATTALLFHKNPSFIAAKNISEIFSNFSEGVAIQGALGLHTLNRLRKTKLD